MSEITKIINGEQTVTLEGNRLLTLEFNTVEEKNEFYECFPLLDEKIVKA